MNFEDKTHFKGKQQHLERFIQLLDEHEIEHLEFGMAHNSDGGGFFLQAVITGLVSGSTAVALNFILEKFKSENLNAKFRVTSKANGEIVVDIPSSEVIENALIIEFIDESENGEKSTQ